MDKMIDTCRFDKQMNKLIDRFDKQMYERWMEIF